MRLQETYLKDILDRINRLEIIAANGKTAFLELFILQDAMIRSFEIIGEAVKQLSPVLTARRPEIAWKSITGFRDVLIHDYAKIDLEIVWLACIEQILPLKAAVEALLAILPVDEDRPDV